MKLRLYLTDDPDEEPRIIEHPGYPKELILMVMDEAFNAPDAEESLAEVWRVRHIFIPNATNLKDEPYADYKFAGLTTIPTNQPPTESEGQPHT